MVLNKTGIFILLKDEKLLRIFLINMFIPVFQWGFSFYDAT